MSRQLEIFEDIADQMSVAQNVGCRDPRGKMFGRPQLSPGLLHAKVAREPSAAPEVLPAAPVNSPSSPDPVPAAVPRVITTPDELLDMLRQRRDELGLTHETIDHIAGWASGYCSKVLSPEPLKGLGGKGLGLVLDALALGIARIEFVEDPALADRMRRRWTKRLRPKMRPRRTRSSLSGALLDKGSGQTLASTTEIADVETPPELPSQA